MELSLTIILRTIAVIILACAALGFAGVSMLNRIRVGAVMAVGVVIVGFIAWPFIEPTLPLTGITLYEGDISVIDAVICMTLAFLAGLISYFVATPYGQQIAPLAAPSGMAYLVFRSGDMFSLINVNHTLAERNDLYAALKWEGFFFLAIIATGYLGVLVAMKLSNKKPTLIDAEGIHKFKFNKGLSVVISVIGTIVITIFVIGILAQNVSQRDLQLTSVVGQAGTGQIAFAVMVAFGIAAFAIRYLLGGNYLVVTFAAAIVTLWALKSYANPEVMEYMTENWPTAFYPRAICAILPIQMVTFAAIGSMAGHFGAILAFQPDRLIEKGDK